MDLSAFEEIIGYKFKDISYLKTALTHSSFSNEDKEKKVVCNERLEFLGDSFLGFTVADYLYKSYPNLPEGELTKVRALIVCEQSLAECAIKLNLGEYLLLGRGENIMGGRKRTSILSDAMEAIIAAIYLDGGQDVARTFVINSLNDIIVAAVSGEIFMDYKTSLQEIVQAKIANVKIEYKIVSESGPDHNKKFVSVVLINGASYGEGTGSSKKEAEQAAAKVTIKQFK